MAAAFRGLALMVATGYYQLYFLLVIMQFYLVFPLVLMLLRRTRGHHGLVVACAVLAQVAIAIGLHWHLFPAAMVKFGQQDALSYIPWPALCLATVAIVFACGAALTGVLARTPLAIPLTGRTQVPRRRPGPLPVPPAAAAAASDQDTVTDEIHPPYAGRVTASADAIRQPG